jgi:O-acetyl-ADP-ribose deacetylase (regulator of RNase III)
VVNTVNEVGVMGKGIALMFRDAFPENAGAYEAACRAGQVRVGHMFVTRNQALVGPRWIINFPTKKHWRNPSRLEWIREGLRDLVRAVRENGIRSVALPPLGCGAGGLEWSHQGPTRDVEWAYAFNRSFHLRDLLTSRESHRWREGQPLRYEVVASMLETMA